MSRSRPIEAAAVCAAVALAAAVLGGCATGGAARARILDAAPVVTDYDALRAELAARDEALGDGVERGGCPVCAW